MNRAMQATCLKPPSQQAAAPSARFRAAWMSTMWICTPSTSPTPRLSARPPSGVPHGTPSSSCSTRTASVLSLRMTQVDCSPPLTTRQAASPRPVSITWRLRDTTRTRWAATTAACGLPTTTTAPTGRKAPRVSTAGRAALARQGATPFS